MATWMITGCSTGLGRALALEALAAGDNVVVTARSVDTVADIVAGYPDTSLALELDVTKQKSVDAALARATDRFGDSDVLVNNAGYGYRSAIEEGDDDEIARLFDTNVYGVIRMIKAVLPGMRAKKSGTIVNISSIGARTTPVGSGYYSATKAALEGLTGSLRREAEPLGIRSIIVEPGAFRTDFAGRSIRQSAKPIADYADTAGTRRIENDTRDGNQVGDPVKAAKAMVVAVQSNNPPHILLLGNDALTGFRSVAEADRGAIAAWEEISAGTDF